MQHTFSEFSSKNQKAIEHIKTDMASLRTGRATVQLLDPVVVQAYGSSMKLIEVASVQAPDPTLLVVSPWDKSLMEATEKAIASAGLNLNPVVDGDIIRIAVPALTQEKRQEMVKLLHKKAEAGKVMLRNVRSDEKQIIEKAKDTAGVSEDDIEHSLEELEKLHKQYMVQIDDIVAAKEKDLLTI